MDISTLTAEQKSVMLAKAMELTVYYEFRHDPYRRVTVIIISSYHMDSDKYEGLFYDETAMHYAWRVLNWWLQDTMRFETYDTHYPIRDLFVRGIMPLYVVTPDRAQAAWLDKILEPALAAGLVPLPDAEED